MFISGLVSVTFRSLSPQEILGLASQAGLQAIEWGGDVHVPHGDTNRAREVGQWMRDAGLIVSAYGSYYRLGDQRNEAVPFEPVLASATALGAPTIRVWAGSKGSADSSSEDRHRIIEDAHRVATMAVQAGISISLEYHSGTLTDSPDSVRSLLTELDRPNIDFLWQPSNGEPVDACAARLVDVLPLLRNVHVFHWWPTHRERLPLAEGEARWRTYIDIIRKARRPAQFLMEFVAQDSITQFFEDAATLKRLLAE